MYLNQHLELHLLAVLTSEHPSIKFILEWEYVPNLVCFGGNATHLHLPRAKNTTTSPTYCLVYLVRSDLTVREHILFYARLKGIPASEEKEHCDTTLKEVGLFSHQNRLSRELSGGMKRRLSIAISLVGQTAIVFMDEPTVMKCQIFKLNQFAVFFF